jgi:hypothetical protein
MANSFTLGEEMRQVEYSFSKVICMFIYSGGILFLIVDKVDVEAGDVVKTFKLPTDSGWVSQVQVMPNGRQLIW